MSKPMQKGCYRKNKCTKRNKRTGCGLVLVSLYSTFQKKHVCMPGTLHTYVSSLYIMAEDYILNVIFPCMVSPFLMGFR